MFAQFRLIEFAVVVAFLAWGAWRWYADRKKREALLQFAQASGWTYKRRDDALAVRWNKAPFGIGRERRAEHVITGMRGQRLMTAFSYTYVEERRDSSGNRRKSSKTYAVCTLRLPAILPQLQVTPENIANRMVDAIGVTADVNLESEDFNRRFRVSGDPRFASDVLSPRTMHALLAKPPITWRIDGNDLIAFAPGAFSPIDLLARLSVLEAVVDGIPDFVWKDRGTSRF